MISSAPQTLFVDAESTAPKRKAISSAQPSISEVWVFDRSQKILKLALVLLVEKTEEGEYLASNKEIMTHGVGRTEAEAVEDYLSMLTDLFDELVSSEDVLAPHLQKELAYLRTIIFED